MRATHRRRAIGIGIAFVLLLWSAPGVRAADPENCLSCHRYVGFGRVSDDGETYRLFHVDPKYYDYALGPHAQLRCTDCHPREEVQVIPHRPVTPVNCTTACHLSVPQRVEIPFGHENTPHNLDQSVHSSEVLRKSNELLGHPLRTGQSECLLCHDEPLFRDAVQTWGTPRDAPIGRCLVCHEEGAIGMPEEVGYYYWHVHARSEPARSHEDEVRVCAVCHSNAAVREHFDLPDATASYLASFHGKAMMLGSEATAGCLDCHVAQWQNVHIMKSHTNEASPTNPGRLATSCRSDQCHPGAGAQVSSAAVHLDISSSGGIEYTIAIVFVVLILFTFGPSLVITTLELFNIAIGRHDPMHHERLRTAEELMRVDQGRWALTRFTVDQRVQHWFLAVLFTLLVLTGFPIKFADRAWAPWIIEFFGGLPIARVIHRWVGLTMILGFVYHLSYVFFHTFKMMRRTGRSFTEAFFQLPMVMNAKDLKQMGHLLAYLLFLRKDRPAGDRFSLKEKFEYFGVFWGCSLLGLTGLLMWFNAWTTRYLPGRTLTLASLIHTYEAFLALIHVGILHMISVILAPAVFPLSRAMLTGDTPAEELAEAHAGFVEDADRQINAGEAYGN